MRLALETALSPVQRAFWRLMRRAVGEPGPVMVASVRRDLFGAAWEDCVEDGMVRARHWTSGELELMAAFVSRLNSCGF